MFSCIANKIHSLVLDFCLILFTATIDKNILKLKYVAISCKVIGRSCSNLFKSETDGFSKKLFSEKF